MDFPTKRSTTKSSGCGIGHLGLSRLRQAAGEPKREVWLLKT